MSSATAVLEAPRTTAVSIIASPMRFNLENSEESVSSGGSIPPGPGIRTPEEDRPARSHAAVFPGSRTRPPEEKAPEPTWAGGPAQSGVYTAVLATKEPERALQPPHQGRALEPDITREAKEWLRGDLDIIHQRIMLLCMEHARFMGVPVKELRLSVKRSWEGEYSELLLQVFVEANFPQSLALWDAIGDSILRWGKKQPPKRRRLLDEQYAVFVEPSNVS